MDKRWQKSRRTQHGSFKAAATIKQKTYDIENKVNDVVLAVNELYVDKKARRAPIGLWVGYQRWLPNSN